MSYILVYNEHKNPLSQEEKGEIDGFQQSPSKVDIKKYVTEKKAKKHFIRFNLARFERLYFKHVYTVTEREFHDMFITKWER